MWTHLINLYWRTLIDLTPIVNPITSGLFFLTFIEGNPPAFVKRAAIKIGLYMAISLIITLLVGVTILHFFGITLPYIRLAGGLLIFAMGWKMLNTDKSTADKPKKSLSELLFYPITMPFTVGGGTIATTISLATYIDQNNFALNIAEDIAVILGILTVSIAVILCCYFAPRLKAILREGGMTVFLFTFALILLPLGLTIGWSGLSVLIQQLG